MSGSLEPKTQRWMLALTSTASLMIALDVLVVATALDQIGKEFSAGVEALQWTINAYTLTFAVLLMTATVAGDRYGRCRIFIFGLVVFAMASAGCALAANIGLLIAARAVQGVGAAILMPMALAQVTAAYPPERRTWALGVYSSVTALSSVFGPVVGGAITLGLAWQWIFWLNVPVGLVAAILAFYRLPEAFGPSASADLPGLGLVTAGVLCLVLGLIRGNDIGWASAQTAAFLAAGLICAVVFVGWERRCKEPMVPTSLFQITPFAAGNIAMFLLNGALMSSVFFMAQFLQVVLDRDSLEAGLCLLPWGIALFVTAPRAAVAAKRFGSAHTVVCGLVVQGLGLVWLAVIARPEVIYCALGTIGVLLIVTYRPECDPPWIGRSYVTALNLNRLGEREIAAMIDRVTGNMALSESIRQDIIERTDGISLFVEEMTKAVLGAQGEGAESTLTTIPSPSIGVPASLHASLIARLDRLGPAKEIAQIGSAIGREFSHALLQAVVRKPETELQFALDRVVMAGLLFRQGVPPHATYLFKHALVKDAAYGTLLREPRRALHARIAETLESQFSEIAENQPELLARHCSEAGLIEKAAGLWGKAGRRSLERSSLIEATEQLTRALDQIATLPPTPDVRREQIRLQVALINRSCT